MNQRETIKRLEDLVTPDTNWAAPGVKVKCIHTPPEGSYWPGTWPPEGMILTVEKVVVHELNKNWLGFHFKEWKPRNQRGQPTGNALFDGFTDPVTPCFEPVDE